MSFIRMITVFFVTLTLFGCQAPEPAIDTTAENTQNTIRDDLKKRSGVILVKDDAGWAAYTRACNPTSPSREPLDDCVDALKKRIDVLESRLEGGEGIPNSQQGVVVKIKRYTGSSTPYPANDGQVESTVSMAGWKIRRSTVHAHCEVHFNAEYKGQYSRGYGQKLYYNTELKCDNVSVAFASKVFWSTWTREVESEILSALFKELRKKAFGDTKPTTAVTPVEKRNTRGI